ncbi:hypothetical protein DICVIV_10533 [Dictyocaulus viviparus]|uniref:Vacuolar protein sorting-associated protein 8 central domain-containing protein n=1 Tax=Dictyocaulus viviparus TaxID=29172 RepID=A0A0D8XM48_DICVI|nr:hypothetical protein DICVIV_10533 [Dictyocaulus viviparus]
MRSVASSLDAEDWLDISDSFSVPPLSLDDILDEVSRLDDQILDERLSGGIELNLLTAESPSKYKLDNIIKVKKLDSISHQLLSFRPKNGFAVAVTAHSYQIAVATSKGTLLIFDGEGRLERFWLGGESDGAASCVTFSQGGKHLAVGYSKGFVKVFNPKSGAIEDLIKEAVQIGRGVLEILYLDSGRNLLTLDSGGSVFEMHTRHKFRFGKSRIWVFKVLIISIRLGGAVVCVFPLDTNMNFPPLLDYIEEAAQYKLCDDFRVCVGRGNSLNMFRLIPRNACTSRKAVVLLHKIQLPQPVVNFGFLTSSCLVAFDEKGLCFTINGDKFTISEGSLPCRINLHFSTSDYKGLTTGGNVSPAMQCLAERACYQSLCRSENSLIALSFDEIFCLSILSEEDQMECYINRGDVMSACMYLCDAYRGRLHVNKKFKERIPSLIVEQLRRLIDITMNGCKEGKISELVSHYKVHISAILNICVGMQLYNLLYEEMWPRIELDSLSRYIFLESLDHYVLDGTLELPPPSLVSAYITHLASEGHFSQLQASVVRFPIHCVDIHYVMSICKQNSLYDGIIFVMNKAFGDYISPLEEMLCDVSSFAFHEVFSDSEMDRGNRLLLYLHCCLAGHAYPFGSLPPDKIFSVPLQVYQCITSLKGKDGNISSASYPYLRLLLTFDAQQVITTLMRMVWQHSSTEFAIVETLQAVPQLDRKAIMRMALSPLRKEICTFLYCVERKFVDLVKCCVRDTGNAIFPIIRRIFQFDLNQQELSEVSAFVCSLIPELSNVDSRQCAELLIDFFPNYLTSIPLDSIEDKNASFHLLKDVFGVKRERQETFVQLDEETEEHLFEVVFQGIVKEKPENLDDVLQDLLFYWLPTGSRSDFCLNLAAASECTNTTILLMEIRNRLDDAFEILFQNLNDCEGDQEKFVTCLDNSLSFCGRHTGLARSSGWLIRIMRAATHATVGKDTAGK